MKRGRGLRSVLTLSLALVAFSGVGFGMYAAARSPLFYVRVFEVAGLPEDAPVDASTITNLAAVPLGKESLFGLDLRAVELRVLANPWVGQVVLRKRFPQTVSISVVFRQPKAVIRTSAGSLSYVEGSGRVFGQLALNRAADLPLITGISPDLPRQLMGALQILEEWERAFSGEDARIDSLAWDEERGYRALVAYPFHSAGRGLQRQELGWGRTMVDLGSEIDGELQLLFSRLNHVVRYLSDRAISARQIYADAGKKIVVKTGRGS